MATQASKLADLDNTGIAVVEKAITISILRQLHRADAIVELTAQQAQTAGERIAQERGFAPEECQRIAAIGMRLYLDTYAQGATFRTGGVYAHFGGR